MDKTRPVFMMRVVSEILGVHPQTLRLYEREGFICPMRQNKQRIYSEEDIERLSFIIQLTRDLGVNRAGVDIILRMRRQLDLMQDEMASILAHIDQDVRGGYIERIRKIFDDEEAG